MERFFLIIICFDIVTIQLSFGYSKVIKNGHVRTTLQDRVYSNKPGEAIDPSFNSKLDEEIALTEKNKAQKRFHPPPVNFGQKSPNLQDDSAVNDDGVYSKPFYNNPSSNFDASTPDSFSPSKLPDVYFTEPNFKQFSEYENKPSSFELGHSLKPLDFPDSYDKDTSSFVQDPYHHDHIIYDYDHHFHHFPLTTTEAPEVMDQRVNKKPYSYYYIGKKLWYIPLYFSIYFIIYIAALVLKSIARHKINFPAHLAQAAIQNARNIDANNSNSHGWLDYIVNVLESIENKNKTNYKF